MTNSKRYFITIVCFCLLGVLEDIWHRFFWGLWNEFPQDIRKNVGKNPVRILWLLSEMFSEGTSEKFPDKHSRWVPVGTSEDAKRNTGNNSRWETGKNFLIISGRHYLTIKFGWDSWKYPRKPRGTLLPCSTQRAEEESSKTNSLMNLVKYSWRNSEKDSHNNYGRRFRRNSWRIYRRNCESFTYWKFLWDF